MCDFLNLIVEIVRLNSPCEVFILNFNGNLIISWLLFLGCWVKLLNQFTLLDIFDFHEKVENSCSNLPTPVNVF